MTQSANLPSIRIEEELKNSYLDYAMSVIVGRALPDVRDGLKPVQRRVLFAMNELSNQWNRPYKKSARVVGDVIGKYHPHGDASVYDALVRMAQPFSLRYVLVDGQGNFGSVDGDSPAAMRYTEVRLTRLSSEIMSDLDSDTVDFVPNYDNSEMAPAVMPTRYPNLLVNGSTGIAVGMATNIPPHHIGEVMSAVIAMIDDPDIPIEGLIEHLQGPDFPTGGIICGRQGILQAYRTGRGKLYVRAKCRIENKDDGRPVIVVDEIPYMVNKARMLEKIAALIKEKKISGISTLRDESDREGMRVVIECQRGENAEVLLNKLYAMTQLQTVFGINMVALDGHQPRCMNLREVIGLFIEHRKEVVRRRTQFELRKAQAKGHILEGLAVSVVNVDEMIRIIKSAHNSDEAKKALMDQKWLLTEFLLPLKEVFESVGPMESWNGLQEDGTYCLSEKQAQSILDLRLHRLTGLERERISSDYQIVIDQIKELLDILRSHTRLMSIIRMESEQIKSQYEDVRKTVIEDISLDMDDLDFIPEEAVVVTLSRIGYVKSQPISQYSAQHRGGKGKLSSNVKSEDEVTYLTIASSHDILLCFSSKGKIYWLKTHHLPQDQRLARGRPISNYIALDADEHVTAMLPVRDYSEDVFVVMGTAKGVVKRLCLTELSRPRQAGVIAVSLDEGDHLVGVELLKKNDHVLLFSTEGKVVRFHGSEIRTTGRTARGVMGMRCGKGHSIVAMLIASEDADVNVLTVTEYGYGKQTPISEYRCVARMSKGVIAMKADESTGRVVSARCTQSGDELVLISDAGSLVRTRASEIASLSRNTKGVRVMNVKSGEKVVDLAIIPESIIPLVSEDAAELDDAILDVDSHDLDAVDGGSAVE